MTGFASGNVSVLLNATLSLAAGRGEINWLDVPRIGAFGAATHVLETVVTEAADGRVVSVTSTACRPLSSGSIVCFHTEHSDGSIHVSHGSEHNR